MKQKNYYKYLSRVVRVYRMGVVAGEHKARGEGCIEVSAEEGRNARERGLKEGGRRPLLRVAPDLLVIENGADGHGRAAL